MHGNKGDYRLGANLKCLRYKKNLQFYLLILILDFRKIFLF